MKHIKLCPLWAHGTEPFPAYRVLLSFGANKSDQKTIPCSVQPDEKGVLPTNKFRVIKTEKGTIMVVDGSDTTNRCLLMVSADSGHRGEVGITLCEGEILAQCSAGNALGASVSVAVILSAGQKIIFYSTGREDVCYHQYTFNGNSVERRVYSLEEYAQLTNTDDTDDYVSL